MPKVTTNHGASSAASELVSPKVPSGSGLSNRLSKSARSGEPGGYHTPASRMARSGLTE